MTGTEILIIASVAMSAAGAYAQGQATKNAAAFETARLEEDATMSKIGALNDEVVRRERLKRVIGSQQAAAAAQGRRVGSDQSLNAIQTKERSVADRDIANIRLMGLSRQRAFGLGMDQARMKSRQATTGMIMGFGTSLINGGMKAYDAGLFSTGTPTGNTANAIPKSKPQVPHGNAL